MVIRGTASSVLDEIVVARRRRIEEGRTRAAMDRLAHEAEARREFRDFVAAISGPGMRVIAELKQASPSRGVIRKEYHCREIAQAYEAGGAAALSVLTEEQYFHGSLTDLIDARDAVGLPVLRKDFILDGYQVYESVAAGADAVLLIVAALSDRELRELIALCDKVRIPALVEVHAEEEVKRALDAGARIIGVNNRNLKTLEVDIETSFRLRKPIPRACLAVSESGIKNGHDLRRLAEEGFNAALIGEQLLLADDPGEALAAMLKSSKASRKESA